MLGCRLCCSIWLAPTAIATCRACSRRIFFIMFESTRLLLFLTAAVLLAVAPGPGMLYVLARSLAGGKREGVLSALGTFLGGMAHVFAAALGVSGILARSAMAFAT